MGRFGHRGKLLNFAEKIYLKEIYFSAKLCGHQIMYLTIVKSSVNSHVGGFPLADPAEVVRNWCGKNERNFENPTAEGFLFFFYFKKSYLDRNKALRRKPALSQCFHRPCLGLKYYV